MYIFTDTSLGYLHDELDAVIGRLITLRAVLHASGQDCWSMDGAHERLLSAQLLLRLEDARGSWTRLTTAGS